LNLEAETVEPSNFLKYTMKTKNEVTILLLLFFAAWVCQFFVYIPVSEDYLLAIWYQDGLLQKISELYEKTGIRRSVGMFTNAPLCAGPLWLTNYVLISMHLIVTLLVYAVCKRIARSGVVGLTLALVAGIFPWGYGAVTYACGSYTLPSSILFLLGTVILLKISMGSKRYQWLYVLLSSIILLACCISGEHYVFAVALTGVLALAASDEGVTFKGLLRPWVLAPVFVAVFYIFLVYITQSGAGLVDSHWREASLRDTFNPRTLLSVWFYQWRNLLFFEPIFNWEAVSLSLQSMGAFRIGIGIALALASLFVLLRLSNKNARLSVELSKPWWRSSLPVLIMMMGAISFVHALAGGYSASSRHQYVPILVFALFLATLFARLPQAGSLLLIWRGVPLWLFACLAILNTWVVVGINRIELQRYDELCHFILVNNPNVPVDLELSPPLNYLWPNMSKTTSTVFDSEYSINLFLNYKKSHTIKIDSISEKKILVSSSGLENYIKIINK
jgi:hypothetical protein